MRYKWLHFMSKIGVTFLKMDAELYNEKQKLWIVQVSRQLARLLLRLVRVL